MEKFGHELHKLFEAIEGEMKRSPVNPAALKKLGNYLRGIEKPKRETLDRLSLLAGFQDWESFRKAIYGDADASAGSSDDADENPNEAGGDK